VAIPTLVRKLPHPLKKNIGDFSNKEKVLMGEKVTIRFSCGQEALVFCFYKRK